MRTCTGLRLSSRSSPSGTTPRSGSPGRPARNAPQGDYIHLTCDDLEPLDGWDVAAVTASDAGIVPAPRVTDAGTGELQSWPAWGREHEDGTDAGFSAIPFLSRAMWEVVQPLFTGHYYYATTSSPTGRGLRAGRP